MSEFYPFAPRESQLEEYREDARRSFSRIGWACFAMMLVMQGGAALLMLGCQLLAMRGSRFMIAFIESEWSEWVIADGANYGLGLPVGLIGGGSWLVRPPPRKEGGWGDVRGVARPRHHHRVDRDVLCRLPGLLRGLLCAVCGAGSRAGQ